jgi:hypothetical protein
MKRALTKHSSKFLKAQRLVVIKRQRLNYVAWKDVKSWWLYFTPFPCNIQFQDEIIGKTVKASTFGYEPRRIFGTAQRFDKHFSCHRQGGCVSWSTCNVCLNVGQLKIFHTAHTRKLSFYSECQLQKRKIRYKSNCLLYTANWSVISVSPLAGNNLFRHASPASVYLFDFPETTEMQRPMFDLSLAEKTFELDDSTQA